MARKLAQNVVFFGILNFFMNVPIPFDPKCYTWLESFCYEYSHGKMIELFWTTSKCTEFCLHCDSQMKTPSETLS